MMRYKAKTLFTGYKLGFKSADLFVGVPAKYWGQDGISVTYGDKTKDFKRKQVVKTETFPDKFKPFDTYDLLYVRWEKRI